MAETQKLRVKPQAIIEDLTAQLGRTRESYDALHRELEVVKRSEQNTRAQFAELKERLAIAEAENQRMHGYIQRVQEDDVVREELVKVGDPEGEQQLVPKRKRTQFYGIQVALSGGKMATDRISCEPFNGRNTNKPKHWVNY